MLEHAPLQLLHLLLRWSEEADALRLSTYPVETNGLLAVSLEGHGRRCYLLSICTVPCRKSCLSLLEALLYRGISYVGLGLSAVEAIRLNPDRPTP